MKLGTMVADKLAQWEHESIVGFAIAVRGGAEITRRVTPTGIILLMAGGVDVRESAYRDAQSSPRYFNLPAV